MECTPCGPDWEIEEGEEGKNVKAGVIPYRPTQEEVDRHQATHLPFRNWCPVCVRAKAPTPGHRRQDKKEEGRIPRISMDYMYMQKAGEDGTKPILVIKDSNLKMLYAMVVNKKGAGSKGIIEKVTKIVKSFVYHTCILRTDQEPAMKEMQEELRKTKSEDLKFIPDGVKSCVEEGRNIIENSGVA